jgi:hypothetical protein
MGSLSHDDAVQEFNFEVEGTAREVTLRTWSYAGGTNARGQVITNGGFDPIVSLFNSSNGALINFNDDSGLVADPVSGAAYDSFVGANLSAGSYTATVTQFQNFPVEPLLSNGFGGSFAENFRSRTSQWALDVSNVENATIGATYISAVPEPVSVSMLLAGLGVLGFMARRRESISNSPIKTLADPWSGLFISSL